jgi:hypothetical protein
LYGHLSELLHRRRNAGGSAGGFLLPGESIDERYIVRDSAEIQHTEDHFAANLHRMIDSCQAAGVKVVLCVEASNLRDWAPFVTEPGAHFAAAELSRRLAEGQEFYRAGRHRQALQIAEEALARDARLAGFHFLAAKCHDALQDRDHAKREYVLARDTDGFPHRSLSSFNDRVRRIARARGVPLYDTEAAFAADSSDGLPGANLFLDQCHPNVRGHTLIADGLLELLSREAFDR